MTIPIHVPGCAQKMRQPLVHQRAPLPARVVRGNIGEGAADDTIGGDDGITRGTSRVFALTLIIAIATRRAETAMLAESPCRGILGLTSLPSSYAINR